MDSKHFAIVQALCRCATVNATDATKHQIDRLGKQLFCDGFTDYAAQLHAILYPVELKEPIGKIVQSDNTPYCTDCGCEDLRYLDQYANGYHMECKDCGKQFMTSKSTTDENA